MRTSNQRVRLARLLVPALLGAAALGACHDLQPVAPHAPPTEPPPTARTLQAFECTGSIHGGVSCEAAAGSAGAASGALIGGQNQYVRFTSGNSSYDAGTGIFQFDVTVQNLMNEAIGTPDGVIRDTGGIQVFFHDGPRVTAGTGSISVANADGTGTFTAGSQPYFKYDEILEKDEVSTAKTWRLNMSSTVEGFTFTLYVETEVQYLLVINEVMANPGANVAYLYGQWFEIHNAGTREVNLKNLLVADSATTGRRPYRMIDSSVVIPGGGYATLGTRTNPDNSGGVPNDYAYGAAMDYSALKVARVYGTDTLTIDRVAYAARAISAKDGISRELKDPALDNADMDGSNWADALPHTVYGRGGRGTPGARNQTCVPLAMTPGEVVRAPGGGFCLAGGAAGAEYTVVPINLSYTAAAPLIVTTTGIVPVSGAPSPNRLPTAGAKALAATSLSALRAADAFELRLRERERRDLARLMPAARRKLPARTAGARRSIAQGVPGVNSLMTLNAEGTGSCTAAAARTGRVKVVGTRVVVVADTSNPAGGLSDADYQEIATRFETLVWPTVTVNFGAPADIDLNGRVIVFFTRAVNALTPGGAAPVTHGFTLRRDLFSSSSCPESNQGEMIYMAAADPAGAVNGNVRTAASVKAVAARTLGHEMAHLINASRRIWVNYAPQFEETWLDEGLAGVAEELLFYAAAVKQPRQNLAFASIDATAAAESAFVAYAAPNYARLREWLLAPHAGGPIQGDDDLATRGAAWAFLRYAADRKGGTESATWSALANTTGAGLGNAQPIFGASNLSYWLQDFAAAMYSDDAVAGTAAAHTQPSWNFRSLYSSLDYDGDQLGDGYPLAPRNPSSFATDAFTLATGGSVAYLRMGVGANATATFAAQAASTADPTAVRYWVIRRK